MATVNIGYVDRKMIEKLMFQLMSAQPGGVKDEDNRRDGARASSKGDANRLLGKISCDPYRI